MADSTHNIVILGGSFAGIGVAHGLLKGLPGLKTQTKRDYKVTMIANSTHFWWSVGAPRAMLKPYPRDIMDSFIPVSKGFAHYAPELFEFVHAEIIGVDTDKKDVVLKSKNDKEEMADITSTLHYDTLVIATGSKGPSPIYSIHGSHIPTLNAYKDIHARLPAAESVMVIGGGSAGVETAGELGHLHGKASSAPKALTIVSGNERLLVALRPAIGARAEEILTNFGVKTLHNVRITDSKTLPSGASEITLSDGSTQTVDVLLIATGRKPASSFLPPSIPRDPKGRVTVDPYMRVPSLSSVYAIGDMASSSDGGVMHIRFAVPVTSGNILAELGGQGKGKEYKPLTTKETQLVPVGPSTGVGAVFGWWLPGFMVKMIKGKNMMFPNAEATVMGTA